MAINRIENIDFDQTNPTQNGAGGGGGTSPNGGGSGGGSSTTQNTTLSNLFVFNISSNESTFKTLLNGETVGDNKRIRITRDDLSRGVKRIEVRKNGYSNNEYYTIEMVDDGLPIIDNPNIEQPLGISTKDIVLTKYTKKPNRVVGTPVSIKNEVSSNLSFTFNKLRGGDEYEEPKSYTSSFNVSGKGSPVSVLKNGNKNAQFFVKSGASTYSDVEGTQYTISSTDLSLYRITNILYTSNNQEKELKANAGESLQISVNLNSDYIFDIITEEVKQATPSLNPQIELVKTDARTYNINSKVGVPLMFRKNKDVQAITVIVGDDVLEFDDLDSGDLCGITIPHNVFDKIGRYNIKIFPFSFDDYEEQVRPAEKGDTIQSKPVEAKFNVKEEVKLPPVDVSDKYNKYKPKVGSGGVGRPVTIDSSDGGSSFVNGPVDNRNIL
jgi:hypothetical protein